MEENILSSVNAEPVANVEPQIEETYTEPVNEPVETDNVEVVDPQQEQRPVQDAQTNAMYAKIRREAEQRAQDKVIADMGYEWNGQPIKTYAEYQQALYEQRLQQEAQEKGKDPELYTEVNSLKQRLNSYERKEKLMTQDTQLATDPKIGSLYNEWKSEVHELADQFNVDYDTAFTLLARERIADIIGKAKVQTEQETIRKISSNAQSSPGALGNSENIPQKSIWDMSNDEFSKMQEKALRGELRNY